MRKLSLAALTVLELTPPEMIQCAENAGYDGVGLRIIPATLNEPRYDFSQGKKILNNCLAILKDSNIKVTDIEILRLLPETNVFEFESTLAIGALLGAKSALIAIDDSDIHRVQDKLSQLSILCSHHGIVPHVEFMPWLTPNTLGATVDLLAPLQAANISILLDTIHFNRSHSDLQDWLRYKGQAPHYLQLCDTPSISVENIEEVLAQARGERRIPGEGYIDNLPEIVRMLPKNLILSLEIPDKNKASIPAGLRAKDILDKTKQWLLQYEL